MFDFKASAQASTSKSILQVNKEKKQWKTIDGTPVTIIAVDQNIGPKVENGHIVTDDDGVIEETTYTTVLLSEYPDNWFGGFSALDRMVKNWVENFDSFDDLNRELKKFGGVKVVTGFDTGNGRKITVLD